MSIMLKFEAACFNGDLENAIKYADIYGITPRHIRYRNCELLIRVTSKGHLNIFMWLVNSYELTVDDMFKCDEPEHYMLNQKQIKELNPEGEIYVDHFTAYSCGAFYQACNKGHTEIVDYILEKFGRLMPYYAINIGIESIAVRNLDAAKRFDQMYPEAKNYEYSPYELELPILGAIERGKVKSAKWIYERNRIKPMQFKDLTNLWPLNHACEKGHLKVVRWVIDTFDVGATHEAFNFACMHAWIDVAQYFDGKLNYKKTDIYDKLCNAYSKNEVKFAQWIVDWFQFDEADLADKFPGLHPWIPLVKCAHKV